MENINTLYGKGSYGIKVWRIWSEENVIHIEANGGRYTELVNTGLAGRSLETQVKQRIKARVRSKLDGGFKKTKEELTGPMTNQLGLVMPMLATPFRNVKGIRLDKCMAQPKLDGHRCLVNPDVAYSRRGKVINTIPEILASLEIPDGVTLDGELYCHGVSLQTISSWVKRRQPYTLKLQYHIYDVISISDYTFEERYNWLRGFISENEFIKLVPTMQVRDQSYYELCKEYNNLGYEGAIVRPSNSKYEIGKRSKGLIKVKPNHFTILKKEDEFECIDVIPSREGLGILVLKAANGLPFKTIAPGTNDIKRMTLKRKEKYIGSYVTCEYSELTDDGKPFHCVALRWREYL